MFAEYRDIVSVNDLMKMLGIGRNMAYGLLKERKIQTLRVGNKYLIPKKCVIDFVQCEIGELWDKPENSTITVCDGLVIEERRLC